LAGDGRRVGGGFRAWASWLAVAPLLASSAPAALDGSVPGKTDLRVERRWWPEDLHEQLIRLLPGTVLEDAARTFLERRVELRLDRDRAYLQIRIPIG
jgi:hypothetical protein